MIRLYKIPPNQTEFENFPSDLFKRNDYTISIDFEDRTITVDAVEYLMDAPNLSGTVMIVQGGTAKVYIVASNTERDALTANEGDFCIVFASTGLVNYYIYDDVNGWIRAGIGSFWEKDQTNDEIKYIDTDGFAEGDEYCILCATDKPFIHNFDLTSIELGDRPSNYDTLAPIWLQAEQDITMSKIYPVITFKLFNIDDSLIWIEKEHTSVAMLVDRNLNIYAEKRNAPGYNLATGGELLLSDNFFANKLVTNEGTASVSVSQDGVTFGTGTVFGIKIKDAVGNMIYEIPCCESNIDIPYVHDVIHGTKFELTGITAIIEQDTYFRTQLNGIDVVETNEDSEIFTVCKLNNTLSIYN